MDVKQLHYFIRVVELRSITKAADQLHIAQPALGIQIRKLEDELGLQLLIRHSRGIEPTEAGAVLAEQAKRLLDGAERIKRLLRDMNRLPQGRVSLGVPHSINLTLSAILVQQCRSGLPGVRLSLVEDFSTILIEWLNDDRLDLACVYRANLKGLVSEPLLRQELYLVSAPGALAPSDAIPFGDVVGLPLIVSGLRHGFRQRMEAVARGLDLTLNITQEIQSEALTKELVEQDLGHTILPLSAVYRRVEAGSLVARRIVDPTILVDLFLTYRERRPLTQAARAVRDIIRALVEEEAARPQALWQSLGAEGALASPP